MVLVKLDFPVHILESVKILQRILANIVFFFVSMDLNSSPESFLSASSPDFALNIFKISITPWFSLTRNLTMTVGTFGKTSVVKKAIWYQKEFSFKD